MAVSTQVDLLKEAGVDPEQIYVEGDHAGRVTLPLCLAFLRAGDTLAVAAIHMLHKTADGINAALIELGKKEVTLWVVGEDLRIAPEHLWHVRLGLHVRKALAGERHRFTKGPAGTGHQAAIKRHSEMPAKDVKARWEDHENYPTIPEALENTGWSQKRAYAEFGKRGTAARRKKK